MNRFLKTLLLLFSVILLGSFEGPVDNKFLLTGGTEKKWRLEYFLFDGYDFTDSVECIKGMEILFHQANSYKSTDPCNEAIYTGTYTINNELFVMDQDTFKVKEITNDKLSYSRNSTAMAKIGALDIAEIEHELTFILYPVND